MIQALIQWVRFSTIAWLVLIAAAVYGLYSVKYRVLELQREIAGVERQLQIEQENLHVVAAEWAYLTRPDRLQALAAKNTKLIPVQGVQVMELSALPFPLANSSVAVADSPTVSGYVPASINNASNASQNIPED